MGLEVQISAMPHLLCDFRQIAGVSVSSSVTGERCYLSFGVIWRSEALVNTKCLPASMPGQIVGAK